MLNDLEKIHKTVGVEVPVLNSVSTLKRRRKHLLLKSNCKFIKSVK